MAEEKSDHQTLVSGIAGIVGLGGAIALAENPTTAVAGRAVVLVSLVTVVGDAVVRRFKRNRTKAAEQREHDAEIQRRFEEMNHATPVVARLLVLSRDALSTSGPIFANFGGFADQPDKHRHRQAVERHADLLRLISPELRPIDVPLVGGLVNAIVHGVVADLSTWAAGTLRTEKDPGRIVMGENLRKAFDDLIDRYNELVRELDKVVPGQTLAAEIRAEMRISPPGILAKP